MSQTILVKLLSLFSVLTHVRCYQVSVVNPVITSQSRSLRAPVSDAIILPCTPEHLGKYVVVWKHGDEVITAGSMMVSPDTRYSLTGGYNLRLENLQQRDQGTYTCHISTLSAPVTLTHSLEILGKPPSPPGPLTAIKPF